MIRKSINPSEWGLKFSLDQGEIVEGARRQLHCSGQVSVTPDEASELGVSVVSAGDIRGQMKCALTNVDAVLKEAGMKRSDLVGLRFYTTDMDGFLANYDVYSEWIDEAGIRPPQSLLGIQRLFHPDLMVEIEVVAAQ